MQDFEAAVHRADAANLFRSSGMNSFVIATAVSVLLIVCGYVLVAIGPVNPVAPDPQVVAALLPNLVGEHPEPLDRFLFVTLVLILPVVLLVAARSAWRLKLRADNPAAFFLFFLAGAIAISVWCNVLPAAFTLLQGRQWIATGACVAMAALVVGLPSGWQFRFRVAVVTLTIVAATILTAGLRVWTVHNAAYNALFASHLEAAIDSPIRIALGGTCLVDVLPQYGCYGEFLAPLLRMFGTTTLAVTGIFAALLIVSICAVVRFADRVVESSMWLFGCLLALTIVVVLNLDPRYPDPYIQYYPLRFFCPALSLLFVLWLQRRATNWRAAAAGAFSAAAMAWNLDSGVAVFISLAAFVVCVGFTSPHWPNGKPAWLAAAMRLGAYLAGAAVFLAGFVVYLRIKSGASVELSNSFVYLNTFYLSGFAMIPMPPFPEYWTIHAGIIGCVLLYVSLHLTTVRARSDPTLESATYLAVLAIGLTIYYTGRSHWLVLRLVSWPDVILFFFLADRASRLKFARVGRIAFALIATIALAIPAAFLAKVAPVIWNFSTEFRAAETAPSEVEEDIDFISSRAARGETIGIFGFDQGILYGETGTRPALGGPSVAEMIRTSDLEQAQSDMIDRGPAKLFVGTNLENAAPLGMLGSSIPLDLAKFQKAYALAAWGPAQRLMYLHRRPYAGTDLFQVDGPPSTWSGPAPQFSASWSAQTGGKWGRPTLLRSAIPATIRNETFSIRLRLEPAKQQSAGSAIVVSNLCCDHRGFMIVHQSGNPDHYVAIVGNGSGYYATPAFAIPSGRVSEVILSYDNGHLILTLDRRVIVDRTGLGPVGGGSAPLIAGSVYNRGNNFAGQILEIQFFNEALH